MELAHGNGIVHPQLNQQPPRQQRTRVQRVDVLDPLHRAPLLIGPHPRQILYSWKSWITNAMRLMSHLDVGGTDAARRRDGGDSRKGEVRLRSAHAKKLVERARPRKGNGLLDVVAASRTTQTSNRGISRSANAVVDGPEHEGRCCIPPNSCLLSTSCPPRSHIDMVMGAVVVRQRGRHERVLKHLVDGGVVHLRNNLDDARSLEYRRRSGG